MTWFWNLKKVMKDEGEKEENKEKEESRLQGV